MNFIVAAQIILNIMISFYCIIRIPIKIVQMVKKYKALKLQKESLSQIGKQESFRRDKKELVG